MIEHVTFGEVLVSGSAVLLAIVAHVLVGRASPSVQQEGQENTQALLRANELVVKALENVATNANDDMAGVAAAAITHSAPVGYAHARKITRHNPS